MYLNNSKYSIIYNLLKIEIIMVLRNQKMRNVFFLGFFLLFQFFFNKIDSPVFIFFSKPIYISIFSILYCEYLFSNQSSYFSLIVTKNITDSCYIYSKYFFLLLINLISFIIVVFRDIYTETNFFLTIYSAIFSFGFIPYLLILISYTNKKKIKLEKEKTSTFRESNFRVLYVFLVIFLVLFLINIFFNKIENKYYALAFLGLIGGVLHKVFMKFIIEKYKRVKLIFIKKFIVDEY